MSLLSDFLTAAHAISKVVIGTEALTIGGGSAINAIIGEASFSRDYEAGGFEQDGSLECVVDRPAFVAVYTSPARSYEGKSATARGETWRVASIHVGKSFVRVILSVPNKSA